MCCCDGEITGEVQLSGDQQLGMAQQLAGAETEDCAVGSLRSPLALKSSLKVDEVKNHLKAIGADLQRRVVPSGTVSGLTWSARSALAFTAGMGER